MGISLHKNFFLEVKGCKVPQGTPVGCGVIYVLVRTLNLGDISEDRIGPSLLLLSKHPTYFT